MDTFLIPEKIQSLVYRKRKAQALWLLGKLISDIDSGIYADYYKEYVRFINMYRIRLFVDWGMYRDALAYVCLESDLYPEDPNSGAYNEFLKTRIINLPKSKGDRTVLKSQSKNWKGIAGMRELKTIFERDIILPFTERELYERYKVPLPNGVLLYGPPGCGKTFIARKLSEQVKFHFMDIKPSGLGSIYVHGAQLEIKKVFEDAEKNQPSILFLDEIEALVPNRSNSDVSYHYKAEVNEFLSQLDQCHKRGILVIGATNLIKNIDPAILRPGRFDKKVFIGPPDLEARIEAFKMHMEGRPQEEIKWLYLAEMTEYYTFAEIEHIVNEAGRVAISKKSLITTNILGAIISSIKPALDKEKMKIYF
ncbi:MAG: ATP-binding protein [Bacteroidales bacterium]|nr:ATP-binding protein [Bacteroidales bacterium]